jgi:hypothetical protein
MEFFIITAVKTSNLTSTYLSKRKCTRGAPPTKLGLKRLCGCTVIRHRCKIIASPSDYYWILFSVYDNNLNFILVMLKTSFFLLIIICSRFAAPYTLHTTHYMLTLMDLLWISWEGSMASFAGCIVRHNQVLTKGHAATSRSSSWLFRSKFPHTCNRTQRNRHVYTNNSVQRSVS